MLVHCAIGDQWVAGEGAKAKACSPATSDAWGEYLKCPFRSSPRARVRGRVGSCPLLPGLGRFVLSLRRGWVLIALGGM